MSVQLLGALIVAGLVGPFLRLPKRWDIPVAVGELLIGTIFGASGFQKIPYQDPTLKLLATVGFALLMFTAGSHIDYRTLTKSAFQKAFWILLANFGLAVLVGFAIDHLAHFSNWKLLAVISFSSSAAFVIPIVQNFAPSSSLSILITQVTLADAFAFITLPFFTQKNGQLKAAEGAGIVLVASVVIYFALRFAKLRGWLNRTHIVSKAENLGLELRISLALLLLVAALAVRFHASVMIAGFSLGVALASIGVPHRLARQLFGVSDGFFAPLYFVWLGASINIRQTFHSKDAILLAVLLCVGAFISHLPSKLFGQPTRDIFLASGQLGIPAAAVTLGTANGILTGAQSGAIMLSMLITLIPPSFYSKRGPLIAPPGAT
jgi:Kef-type K+ transport system membrane component KefB